jgi:hypothetical protein
VLKMVAAERSLVKAALMSPQIWLFSEPRIGRIYESFRVYFSSVNVQSTGVGRSV